jgi:hypothetical protein
MYKDLIKDKEVFSLKTPQTIVPIPSNDDYAEAYIVRYFIQRANDVSGFVYEISQSEYEDYFENPYWISATMRWRISGPLDVVYDMNGKLLDKGVIASNKASLSMISLKIKNISLYLPNIKQFHK